jgi:hypothetical protein
MMPPFPHEMRARARHFKPVSLVFNVSIEAPYPQGGGVMKVVVIGATGTIGKALVTALSGRHDVIRATRRLGIKVDIEDALSIDARTFV